MAHIYAISPQHHKHITSGVLGGIRGYTAYTNLRGFLDSVYSPQRL